METLVPAGDVRPNQNSAESRSRAVDRACLAVFVLGLLHACYVFSVGLNHSVLGFHGFRQAQTAISIDYMVRNGLSVRYDTPIFGPPWSIPFEFPLYQWIVAIVVRATGFSIDGTARAVNFAAFLLCFIPLRYLLVRLGLRPGMTWLALTFLVTSPLFLFWSRAVMIESVALLLGICYLAALERYRQTLRAGLLVAASVFGCVAALAKVTTVVPMLAVAGAGFLHFVWMACRSERRRRPAWNIWSLLIISLASPVMVGAAWNSLADDARGENVLGALLASDTTSIRAWVYGTFEQRTDLQTWRAFRSHASHIVWPGATVWLVSIVALAACVRMRTSYLAAGCAAFGLVGPLLFTNLYFVHEYYWYANGVFFVIAAGLTITELLDSPRWRAIGAASIAIVIALNVRQYWTLYLPMHTIDDRVPLTLAAQIQQATAVDDVVVYTGFDWSSEIPYYTRRRALMIPDWPDLDRATVKQAIDNLKQSGARVGALVVRPGGRFSGGMLIDDLTTAGIAPRQVIEFR